MCLETHVARLNIAFCGSFPQRESWATAQSSCLYRLVLCLQHNYILLYSATCFGCICAIIREKIVTRNAYDTHILIKCSYILREQRLLPWRLGECGCGGIDRFVMD